MKHVFFFFLLALCTIATGQFNDPVILSGHAFSRAVFTEDIDSDGDEDIIYSSSTIVTNKIVWHENLGNGKFVGPQILITDSFLGYGLDIKDMDGDGDWDIITDIYNPPFISLAWYENTGGMNFIQHFVEDITVTSEIVRSVNAGDIDGDGDMDIVASVPTDNEIFWYENNGGGFAWTLHQITSGTMGINLIVIEDMDADGDGDLLCTHSSPGVFNSVTWKENQGAGSGIFVDHTITNNVDMPTQAYYVDLDNDGLKDILSSSRDTDDKVFWCKNLGSSTFSPVQIISTSVNECYGVLPVDMDGDGDIDVISTSQTDNKIAWYSNNGAGLFGGQQIISNQYQSPFLASAGDFNSDGEVDLATIFSFYDPTADCNAAYFLNDGGSFGQPILLAGTIIFPSTTFPADLDGDGDLDLLAGSYNSNNVVWYENLGDHKFSPLKLISSNNEYVRSVYAADINGDGYKDVLAASEQDDKLCYYLNDGSGNFGSAIILGGLTEMPSKVRVVDFDHDGDQDIFACIYSDIIYYQNPGTGVFGFYTYLAGISGYDKQIEFGDVDQDGWEDVIYTDNSSSDILYWKKNYAGSFGAQLLIDNSFGSAHVNSISIGDLDGDGLLDIVVGLPSQVMWYKKLSGTSFSSAIIIDNGFSSLSSVHLMDSDADGDQDIFVSLEQDMEVWSYENLGDGNFSSAFLVSNNITKPKELNSADFDQDGDRELIFASYNDMSGEYDVNQIGFFENQTFSQHQFRGRVFVDYDQNGEFSLGDTGIHLMQLNTNPQADYSFTFADGDYFLNLDTSLTSWYELSPNLNSYWQITSDSASYNIYVDNAFSFADSLNFGIFADTLADLIQVDLSADLPLCNSIVNYWLSVTNIGTTLPSPILHLKLDDDITYISSQISPDSIVGQNLYWHLDSIFYFSEETFAINVQMPDFTFMGDTLISSLITYIDSINPSIYSDTSAMEQILVCAYDPNDKIANPSGILNNGYVPLTTQKLQYTIRFQNTGTATATDVIINDPLSADLKWHTLNPIAWSHDIEVDVNADGVAIFTFENIMLPDSGSNEPASHGFVKFEIELQDNLPAGTVINNTAYIYFDQNPAIVTNTKINTLYECTSPVDFEFSEMANDSICIQSGLQNLVALPSGGLFSGAGVVNDTFDPLVAGTGLHSLKYSFSDSLNCQFIDSISVQVIGTLVFPVFTEMANDSLCIYSGAQNLSAFPAGGVFSGQGIISDTFDPSLAGIGAHSLTYTVSDSFNCQVSDSISVYVSDCLGSNEIYFADVSIYPNPSDEITTISFGRLGAFAVVIYSVGGQPIFQTDSEGSSIILSTQSIAPGTYILQVTDLINEVSINYQLIILRN